jgi:hypothetical protein
LRDPIERIEYLIVLAEGKSTIETEVPSDLFDEIFELQEAMEEIKQIPADDAAGRKPLVQTLETAREKFQQRQEEEQKELEVLSARWDTFETSRDARSFTEAQSACLKEMKKVLSHRGYLDRILSDIDAAIGKGI